MEIYLQTLVDPTAVGGHTLTATITDGEGKSKSVAVVITGSNPPLNFTITPRIQISNKEYPYDLVSSDISVHNKNQYPDGSSFNISCGSWVRVGKGHVRASVTVTDRWGQRLDKTSDVFWNENNDSTVIPPGDK